MELPSHGPKLLNSLPNQTVMESPGPSDSALHLWHPDGSTLGPAAVHRGPLRSTHPLATMGMQSPGSFQAEDPLAISHEVP